MVTGILGGSFDPPHEGHLTITQLFLTKSRRELSDLGVRFIGRAGEIADGARSVRWVPANEHRLKRVATPFATRLHLCRLALSSLHSSAVALDAIEYEQPSAGKSLLMLEKVKEKTGDTVVMLMGDDNYQSREQWYRFEEIESRFGVVVFPRRDQWLGSVRKLSSSALRADVTTSGLSPEGARYIEQSPEIYN